MPTQISPRVAALLERTRATRARLIFAFDCTASRAATWDMASSLQTSMFEEAARIGGLEVRLNWYRGDECSSTPWTEDTGELATQMRRIRCEPGATQIKSVLEHIREEHGRKKVNAAVFVGDAIEETPQKLYDAAAGLGVPLFLFLEGDGLVMLPDQHGRPLASIDTSPQKVETVFREIARLTGGAYARFDAGAASKLGELLRAAATFAVGGEKALANLNSDSARKLLAQMK